MRELITELFDMKNYASTVNEVLEVRNNVMRYDLISFVR